MKAPSYYPVKLFAWFQCVCAGLSYIGILWWLDAHDLLLIPASLLDWLDEIHFLIKLSMYMGWVIILWFIVMLWWIMWRWITKVVITIFYR